MEHGRYMICGEQRESLMSRAGVPSGSAERALGRAIPGIRPCVYDHHKYLAEEKTAFGGPPSRRATRES